MQPCRSAQTVLHLCRDTGTPDLTACPRFASLITVAVYSTVLLFPITCTTIHLILQLVLRRGHTLHVCLHMLLIYVANIFLVTQHRLWLPQIQSGYYMQQNAIIIVWYSTSINAPVLLCSLVPNVLMLRPKYCGRYCCSWDLIGALVCRQQTA